ncbi:MAG TPA: sulfotransferase [Gammaproteobacteria bacterium]
MPNFLVIGAPRCGTTWIDENLRRHPEIYMPPKKELHFFDRHYERGIEHYEASFAGWNGEKAVGEATPDYVHGLYTSHGQDVAGLIAKHLPDAKLIVSLRNPVERAYSHFLNVKAKHEHNLDLTFEEKLRKVRGGAEIIREGFYAEHLSRYYALFPRENILVLLYDDLVADPKAFLERIYRFLGVDPGFESPAMDARINMAAGKKLLARSKSLWYLSRALTRLDAHRLAERVCKLNARPEPRMSDETRRMLVDVYREPNEKLERLLGRDLSHWSA